MAFNLVTWYKKMNFSITIYFTFTEEILNGKSPFYAVQGRGVVRTNDRINRKEKNHFWELLSETTVRLTTSSALEEAAVHRCFLK